MDRQVGEVPKTQGARTRWAMLDRFIEALADMGDGVCGAPPEGRYFEEMQRLLCRGDLSVVPRYAPYYHYVFAAFYALFHRGDVGLAEAVAKILTESHVRDEFANSDDVHTVRILSIAVRAIKAADCNRPEVFRAQLKMAAEIIRGEEEAGSWSHLFRDLVAAYLDPSAEAAGRIKKAVEEILREAQETAEAYGISGPEYGATPPLYFIYKMAERLEKEGYPLEKLCLNNPHKLFPPREGH
jgi:hypothetical protein